MAADAVKIGTFVGCSLREMSFSILAPDVGANPVPVPRTTPNLNSVLGPSQWTWSINDAREPEQCTPTSAIPGCVPNAGVK